MSKRKCSDDLVKCDVKDLVLNTYECDVIRESYKALDNRIKFAIDEYESCSSEKNENDVLRHLHYMAGVVDQTNKILKYGPIFTDFARAQFISVSNTNSHSNTNSDNVPSPNPKKFVKSDSKSSESEVVDLNMNEAEESDNISVKKYSIDHKGC